VAGRARHCAQSASDSESRIISLRVRQAQPAVGRQVGPPLPYPAYPHPHLLAPHQRQSRTLHPNRHPRTGLLPALPKLRPQTRPPRSLEPQLQISTARIPPRTAKGRSHWPLDWFLTQVLEMTLTRHAILPSCLPSKNPSETQTLRRSLSTAAKSISSSRVHLVKNEERTERSVRPSTSITLRNPFRMNTCKSLSKQATLTFFRMNTYEKTQGVGYQEH
jgi:hypothetical protein